MRKLIGATLALTLLGATAAVAQPYGGYDRNGIYDNRGFDNRYDRNWNGDRFMWRRGMMFRDHSRFVVRDWWRHGLHRPARNQHWTQHGNVFLLVNRRGIVVDVVFRPRFGYGYGGARF
jgi:Ni/Co efflux regulator RcnB